MPRPPLRDDDVSVRDQIKEIDRELAIRSNVLPHFVGRHYLSPQEADRQLRTYAAIRNSLLKYSSSL